MSLPKFIHMIDFSDIDHPKLNIPFTRLDIQPDPIEGISKYNEFIEIISNRDKHFKRVEDDGGEIIDRDATSKIFTHFLGNVSYEDINTMLEIRRTSFVSCWVNGDKESLPMWNLYAGIEGVFIMVNKESLINKLKAVGVTKYGNAIYKKENVSIENAPFHKNEYYEYENEFRFLIKSESKEKVIIKTIDLDDDLEFSVKTHPQVPEWIKDCYSKVLKVQSIHINNSEFEIAFKKITEIIG